MAIRIHKTKASTSKRNSLSMQIYAAMLGGQPSVEAVPTTRPRLRMRVKLEAKIEHAGTSPFHRTTLREHVGRYAAYAIRALDEARDRLGSSRLKPIETLGRIEREAMQKPIVLVGPASAKTRTPIGSRAA